MPLLATALSLAPTVIQGVQAAKQKKLAKNLKKSDYIPPGVLEAEAIARQQANATELPGQGRIEDNLEKQTANTLSAARRTSNDSASVMEQVQAADAKSKEVVGDLGVNLAEFKRKNQKDLQSTLERKGQYEKQNQDAYDAAKSALKGASSQNAFNAVSNAASAGLMLSDGINPATGNPFGSTGAKKATPTPPAITPEQQAETSNMMSSGIPSAMDPNQVLMNTVLGKYKKQPKYY